ncbi:MAG: hypothetical protein QOF68_857 [Gaiellales bacterium]|nr:hypothetical protein [Gaiellales bacterium]
MDSIRKLTPTMLFIASVVLSVVFLALANFGDDTGQGGTGPYIFTVAISAAVAAMLLFRLWGSLTARPGHWGFVLGLLAFLSCAVFWLGLPFAFGVPAVAVAARSDETLGKVGLVLGALGVLLGAVGCVVG